MYKTNIGNPSTQGIVFVLLSVILLSFRGILTKYAFAENVSLMDLFYIRFLIAIPLLWLFSYAKRKKEIPQLLKPKIIRNCLLAGFFGYYFATLTDLYSLKLIDVSINRVVIYTFPAYVLIWNAYITKTIPEPKYIVAFFAIQVALYFVLGGFDISLILHNKEGALWALAAAIGYSLYVVINQETGKKIGSILFTTYAVTFSFLFINIHYFITEPGFIGNVTLKGLFIIFLIAIFCTFAPLLFFSEGIKQIGASRASFISMSGPVLTVIFAYFTLGETLTYQQILGAVSVIVILALMEKRKRLN